MDAGPLAQPQPALEPPAATGPNMRRMAIIVAVALFMQNIDSTVVSTAMPSMARSFHADPLHMSVTLTSYLISLSVFIPASGWAADKFGARTVFRAAIVVFTVASVACGLAPSLAALVLARAAQGLGGAMMVPVGRLLLLRSISKAQMVSAMSWVTVPSLVGPVLGPPLGGFIVSIASWRWVFGINLPIGVLGVIAVSRYIPQVREPGPARPLDVPGLLLTGLAMAALTAGLETLGRGLVPLGWSFAALGIGIAAAGLYWLHQRRTENPVLDLSLMRIDTFANSMIAGSLFRLAIGAIPYLLPLMLQLGFGYTPLHSGLTTFTAAAGAILMKPAARPVLRRFGFRTTLMANGLISAAGIFAVAAFRPGLPSLLLSAVLLVSGFFRSLQFTAYNTIAYGDIPRERMSAATSFYSTIQQLTLTLGIVLGAASLEFATRLTQSRLPALGDYSISFVVIGLVALTAVPVAARLPRGAGAELSGHGG